MKKLLLLAATVISASALAPRAHAGLSFAISIGPRYTPPPVRVAVPAPVCPMPVVVARPVCAPAPVVIAPPTCLPPVVVAAPVCVAPPPPRVVYYGHGPHGRWAHYRHGYRAHGY